jgi:chromate reductase, NAD(P)H dehydrogenase (quinone)
LAALAPEGLELVVVEIQALPLFNPDLETRGATAPAAWVAFRQAVQACDALLFITPEYNRSVPAVLKNALEIGSRPYGKSVWAGKAAAIATQSTGMLGGFGANHHLRQILVFLDVHVLPQPEIYLSQVDKLFNEQGALLEGPGRDLLLGFLEQFKGFIGKHAPAGA